MSLTIAAIGEQSLLEGFRLAGATLYPCRSEAEVLDAWKALPGETAVVVLTPSSADVLAPFTADPRSPMSVVIPS
jgi:vacuolar-type H+-ATPase subunit F/Vma7